MAAGWISGESLVDELPCDSDGKMAINGDAWRQWWVEFDAIPDVDDDGMLPDAPPYPSTSPEARGLFGGLRNVSVFVEGPEFDLSMVLVGSATWYGAMGVCSLDGFVIATLDAMTHDSLIMALTSGAPQPVEKVRGKAGAAYLPPWTADLPVLLITREMRETQAQLDRAWSQLMP